MIEQKPTVGILLTNLGTPEAPTPKAVRRYLAEFLWDPRVVQIPRLIWWLILNGIILRIRPRASAKLYEKVWTSAGSPLLAISKQQVTGLQTILDKRYPGKIRVALGMRYGKPSIADALNELKKFNVNEILIFPLYPQYASATVGSTFDAVAAVLTHWQHIPHLKMITHYSDQDNYILTLANHIQHYWQAHGRGERLIFSFHGLPKRTITAGDPYYDMCINTAKKIAEKLNLDTNGWLTVFQSRFGREEWLQPYCDITLQNLGKQGFKKLDIICPGFSADCLETLEEIAKTNAELFHEAGGEQLNYIPALNANPEHLQMLADIAVQHLYLNKR